MKKASKSRKNAGPSFSWDKLTWDDQVASQASGYLVDAKPDALHILASLPRKDRHLPLVRFAPQSLLLQQRSECFWQSGHRLALTEIEIRNGRIASVRFLFFEAHRREVFFEGPDRVAWVIGSNRQAIADKPRQ